MALGEESAPAKDSWFVDALEDTSAPATVKSRLGEGDIPSSSEISADPEKGIPSVVKKGSAPGGSPPVEPQADPLLPEQPRNPYGQLLQDMEDQKLSQAAMTHKMNLYQKMQSMAASDLEQDATNNDIIAINDMLIARKPSKKTLKKLNDKASIANQQLLEAEQRRRKMEGAAAVKFATKGFKPVEDTVDAFNPGPFSQNYQLALKMKRMEMDAKALKTAFRTNPIPNSIKRDLEPNKKDRDKLRAKDDRYQGHERSMSPNPRQSKAYEKAQSDLNTKKNLVEMLAEAADQFKSARLTEPNLKYEDFVAGTAIEGIDNFQALNKEEQGKFAIEFAKSAEEAAPKELKLEEDTEKYRQAYDKDASTLPYEQWTRSYTMDRQANKEVEPSEETAIEQMEKQMMQKHLKPDIDADIADVVNSEKAYNAEQDQLVAKVISERPSKATFQQMQAENILGAKQLEEDTKEANARLVNVTAHPESYGSKKPLNPDAQPNYRQTEALGKKIAEQKTLKQDQKRLLKDAEELAESGKRSSQKILEADEKAAGKGEPPMNKEARDSVRDEQKFFNKMKDQFGEAEMKTMQKSTAAAYKKTEQSFDNVKGTISEGAVGPKYGAEGLKSLPTRSKDPQLESPADYNLNGNTENAGLVNNMNNVPGDGSSKMPAIAPADSNVDDAKDEEEKIDPDLKKDDAAIANGQLTEEEVAKKSAESIEKDANVEAKLIEGKETGDLYKDPLTGGVDKLAIEMKAAANTEQEISDATNDKKIMADTADLEMPKPKAEFDDKPYQVWNTKDAVETIEKATSGPVADKNDLDTDVTAAGVPNGQSALPTGI